MQTEEEERERRVGGREEEEEERGQRSINILQHREKQPREWG